MVTTTTTFNISTSINFSVLLIVILSIVAFAVFICLPTAFCCFFFPFCLVARKRREAKEKKTHAQSKETPNY